MFLPHLGLQYKIQEVHLSGFLKSEDELRAGYKLVKADRNLASGIHCGASFWYFVDQIG